MAAVHQLAVFKRASRLENQMDEFLDHVSEAGLLFRQVVRLYIEQGESDEFTSKVERVIALEHRCDVLRREIETELFERTLIPDLRADVLELLEGIDHVVNMFEDNTNRFADEIPLVPEAFHRDFNDLAEAVVECVEAAVLASRAFFRNADAVRDHIHKVGFFESEADAISSRAIRKLFRSELPLERKVYLRGFLNNIDDLADRAEDLADHLAICAIKRRI